MPYSEDLLGLRNADGGWGYHRGSSWAEPTCLAVLALSAGKAQANRELLRAAVQWLGSCQRPDGGIAPSPAVRESTWLTALTLLLPEDLAARVLDRQRAIEWVLAQSGRESGWVYRLRLWMLGEKSDIGLQFDGWPWYPGTAAWVSPTAISVLALAKLIRQGYPEPKLKDRLAQGRSFLLERHCRDGGWNHGSTKALGYDSESYPETTGMALLALHDVPQTALAQGLERGEQHLAAVRSSEAQSWLRLGLLAHGRKPSVAPIAPRGGTMAVSLASLAASADAGRNVFLEA